MLRPVPVALALLALAACGDAPPTQPDPAPVPPAVATVAVDPPLAELVPGDSVQVRATLRDSLGREIRDRVVAWRSSDTLRVTVSSTGVVRAVRDQPGEVAVIAESEGRSGRATIRVAAPPPGRISSVVLQPYPPTLAVGGVRRMRVFPVDRSGARVEPRSVKWTTSDPSVLAVSDSGVARGVAAGAATLTVEVDGVRSSIAYQVARGYTSTELPFLPFDLADGGQVAGIVRPAGGQDEVVVWEAGTTRRGPRAGYIDGVAVNSRGDVAGTWRARFEDRRRGFLWAGGQVREIVPPDTAADVFVADVNSAGRVVGSWSPCGAGCARRRAFAWEDGVFTDLGGLGGAAALAAGINDAGWIVATVHPDTAAGATPRVVVLRDGARTDVAAGQARAINAAGDVVGWSWNGAFIHAGGSLHVIEAGRHQTVTAAGIGAGGEAAVTITAGSSDFSGYVWRGGRLLMLLGLVADRDVYASPVSLLPLRVNERGQVLATGRDRDGGYSSFLLTPLPR